MKIITLFLGALLSLPVYAQISLYLEGESGITVDWSGQFSKLELTEDNAQFVVDHSIVQGGLHLRAFDKGADPNNSAAMASVSIEGPSGGFPGPGHYEAVEFQSATSYYAGISTSGSGNNCSNLLGEIQVYEVLYDGDGNVESLSADFRVRCKSALRYTKVKLRFNSFIPLHLPEPEALAGEDQTVLPGTTVLLDGSASSNAGEPVESYHWRQIGGPWVELIEPETANPNFVFPADIEQGVVELELEVSGAGGKADTDRVLIQAGSPSAGLVSIVYDLPHNYWSPAEVLRQEFDPELVEVFRTMRKGVKIEYNQSPLLEFEHSGSRDIDIDSAPFAARLGGSVYGDSVPNLYLHHYCDYAYGPSLNSFFNIVDRAYDEAGNVSRFAIDYEDQCNDYGERRLMGRIRYNSLVSVGNDGVYAIAGPDRKIPYGHVANLVGFFSYAGNSSRNIVGYSWEQVGGPPVALSDRNTPVALVDTSALASGDHQLTFRLTVADAQGRKASDEVKVQVFGPETPVTRAALVSAAGSWVGDGRVLTAQDEYSAEIRLQQNDPEQYPFTDREILNFNVISREGWDAQLRMAEGERLIEGSYFEMESDAPSGQTRFSSSVGSRTCTNGVSDIEVKQLQRDGRGQIHSLALDFNTLCLFDGSQFSGYFRFNSNEPIPVGQPEYELVAPEDVYEGEKIQIKMKSPNVEQLYVRWNVFVGPKYTLGGAFGPSPYMIAPSVPPGGDRWLVFRAEVRDKDGNYSERYASVRIRDDGESELDWVEAGRANDKPLLLEGRAGKKFGFRVMSLFPRNAKFVDLKITESDLPDGLGVTETLTPVVSAHVAGLGEDGYEIYLQTNLTEKDIMVAYKDPDRGWLETAEASTSVEKLDNGWTKIHFHASAEIVPAPTGRDYGKWITVAIGSSAEHSGSAAEGGAGTGSSGGGGSIGCVWLLIFLVGALGRIISKKHLTGLHKSLPRLRVHF